MENTSTQIMFETLGEGGSTQGKRTDDLVIKGNRGPCQHLFLEVLASLSDA